MDFARFPFHPIEQRGAEVEAQVFVDGDLDPLVAIVDSDGHERLVRLARHAHIPIAIGRGRWLGIGFAGPWILSLRLVDMSGNDHQARLWSFVLTTSSMRRSRVGIT